MLHKPDTLVILTPGFPENETDTTCLPLQQSLLRTIRQNNPGLNLVVLSFQYPFKKQSYTWYDIPVEAFGGKGRAKGLRIYNWVKVWLKLKRLMKTHHIKGILSFWLGECAFIGQQFANQYHLKHRCWILGQDAKINNRYFWLTKPKSNSLIAISDAVADNVHTNYGVIPEHVIPGGIDTAMFSKVQPERDIDILGVGSLIPLKQYHLFIEVICRLRKRFPQIKAVLCGDGPEQERLAQMIRKLNLKDNITITGKIPYQDVLGLMQRTKVFLHPSNYEGLVMVCLEALYGGAKVVSFVRCMHKPIQNWYPVNSTLDMANIINGILENPAMEYTSVAPYKIEDIAAQMVNLYVDKPATIALMRPAMAPKESVNW